MPVVTLGDVNAICTAAQLGKVLGPGMRQIDHLEREEVLKRARSKLSSDVIAIPATRRRFIRNRSDNAGKGAESGNPRSQNNAGIILHRERSGRILC
jgi:hypothetical protein